MVHGKAGDWVKDWGLTKQEARTLYLEVSALLKALKVTCKLRPSLVPIVGCFRSCFRLILSQTLDWAN